jgi:hypothetical protein
VAIHVTGIGIAISDVFLERFPNVNPLNITKGEKCTTRTAAFDNCDVNICNFFLADNFRRNYVKRKPYLIYIENNTWFVTDIEFLTLIYMLLSITVSCLLVASVWSCSP